MTTASSWSGMHTSTRLTPSTAACTRRSGSSVGSAFRINSKRREIQRNPSVAGLLNGGFVVTWDAAALDGSYLGIAGRRYGVDGAPLTARFRVNQYSANDQTSSALTPLKDGGFVGAWQSLDQDGWG